MKIIQQKIKNKKIKQMADDSMQIFNIGRINMVTDMNVDIQIQ